MVQPWLTMVNHATMVYVSPRDVVEYLVFQFILCWVHEFNYQCESNIKISNNNIIDVEKRYCEPWKTKSII